MDYGYSFNTIRDDIELKQISYHWRPILSFNTIRDDIELKPQMRSFYILIIIE